MKKQTLQAMPFNLNSGTKKIILGYGTYDDSNNLAVLGVDVLTNKPVFEATINAIGLKKKLKKNQAYINTIDYRFYKNELLDFLKTYEIAKNLDRPIVIEGNEFPLYEFDLSKMWNFKNRYIEVEVENIESHAEKEENK
jgi:hypothetical protein